MLETGERGSVALGLAKGFREGRAGACEVAVEADHQLAAGSVVDLP
jgi:hypothetical protein